ncbi:MAG: Omp28-related outer membrane protein [Flavobacteriales bacterium]|nr:Omp28-related outer membrane protein [Flavobacteriales bacterium]
MRNALLENFTAINCGNCPAASSTANNLAAQYGEDLVRINIHGGDLASPSPTQPDLRTVDGAALWNEFNVLFQPQGMIDRLGLTGASEWNSTIVTVNQVTSPVNIGVASAFDVGNNTINVEVELYYTDDGPVAEDRIHVALTQDHIMGWQTDYVNGNQPNYDHRNVLRDLITSLEGDPVTTTLGGTWVQRSYSISLDDAWELEDLNVVAFVSEANGAVYQTRSVDANGGTTVGVSDTDRPQLLGQAWPIPATDMLHIPVTKGVTGLLLIRDASSRVIHQVAVVPGETIVRVPVDELAPGLYFYSVTGGSANRFIVE